MNEVVAGLPISVKQKVKNFFKREVPYGEPYPPSRFALAHVDIVTSEPSGGVYVFYLFPLHYVVRMWQRVYDWWEKERTGVDAQSRRNQDALHMSYRRGFEDGRDKGFAEGFSKGYAEGIAAVSNLFSKHDVRGEC